MARGESWKETVLRGDVMMRVSMACTRWGTEVGDWGGLADGEDLTVGTLRVLAKPPSTGPGGLMGLHTSQATFMT